MQQLSPSLFLFRDTCCVYLVRSTPDAQEAVLIDFGSGDILDHLAGLGITRVTHVLMTHHHRDQGQGLARAVAAGIEIWVPHTEQDLFAAVDAHWQARPIFNNYNMRQDRFSLLEPVPVAGTLRDYDRPSFARIEFTILPTPGHTTGSVTLLAGIDNQLVAFTGDLISAPGKLHSLAATQWSYNGAEGAAASLASVLDLAVRHPDLLLPSHGSSIQPPAPALDLLAARLRELLDLRHENPRLAPFRDRPYVALSPHLLRNRTCMAYSHVLLSQTGNALFFDYGYDFLTGLASGSDRASRRPWLYTLPVLKRDFGVTHVDVAIPTHYHDDHIAGMNLLRDNEGTRVWAPENFADVLQRPARYDLPCLWYDPLWVDRVLPFGPFQWEEYELTLYPQPGHTLYAAAISFEVDGQRVLVIGDQYSGADAAGLNYVYQNRFRPPDYSASAALYLRVSPDLILSGHWEPFIVPPGYFQSLDAQGAALERLHRDLLPDDLDPFSEEQVAWLRPYQSTAHDGEQIHFELELRNPLPPSTPRAMQTTASQETTSSLPVHYSLGQDHVLAIPVIPPTWTVEPARAELDLAPGASAIIPFVVTVAGIPSRRVRLAADVTIDQRRFGQVAEALVTLLPGGERITAWTPPQNLNRSSSL